MKRQEIFYKSLTNCLTVRFDASVATSTTISPLLSLPVIVLPLDMKRGRESTEGDG